MSYSPKKIQAIAAMFDAGSMSGSPFYRSTDGDQNTVIPATSEMFDQGLYPDIISFLNGYGNQRDLMAELTEDWIAAGGDASSVWSIIFDYNNVILKLEAPDDADREFTVDALSADFDYMGMRDNTTFDSVTYVEVRAAYPFIKGCAGVFTASGALSTPTTLFRITKTAGGDVINVPRTDLEVLGDNKGAFQSIPGAMRYSVGDNDDKTLMCLEKWDNDVHDPIKRRIRWGITDEGRVYNTYPKTEFTEFPDPDFALVWNDNAAATALKEALGFIGDEVSSAETSGDYGGIVGSYTPPSLLLLNRGFSRWDERLIQNTSVVNLMNGDLRGRNHYTAVEISAAFTLGGTLSATPIADHAVRNVFPKLTMGAKCSVFQQWGECRLDLPLVREYNRGDRDGVYGLVGRRNCRISDVSPEVYATSYAPNTPRIITAEVPIVFRERKDG